MTRAQIRTQLNPKGAKTELAHKLAKLVFIRNAAMRWRNERLRIDHTTYTPEGRKQAIDTADNALIVSIEAVESAE